MFVLDMRCQLLVLLLALQNPVVYSAEHDHGTSIKEAMNGDDRMTYFAYLSSKGRMPGSIQTLIQRYDIRVYDEVGYDESERAPPGDESIMTMTSLGNYSANNNDDDVDPSVKSPPPPQVPVAGTEASLSPKVMKLKLPSLPRRLSKFGKRSSSDKNKSAVEATSPSPSGSQLVESPSSEATSVTTVDDPHPHTPDTAVELKDEQKSKDQDEQADKCEGAGMCN